MDPKEDDEEASGSTHKQRYGPHLAILPPGFPQPSTGVSSPSEYTMARRIAQLVARHTGVSIALMKGKRKTPGVVRAREKAFRLTREFSELSFPEIGKFYHKDHSTVLQACDRVDISRETDASYAREYDLLASQIKQFRTK